ncbi:hypothetical protein [Coleofasciculus sp. FACHB-SPT9]|uniref:hypothetical protein n=1 Tax=unclassified Coleofasciculus TaxID=2692782 RepID=UPI00403F1807
MKVVLSRHSGFRESPRLQLPHSPGFAPAFPHVVTLYVCLDILADPVAAQNPGGGGIPKTLQMPVFDAPSKLKENFPHFIEYHSQVWRSIEQL